MSKSLAQALHKEDIQGTKNAKGAQFPGHQGTAIANHAPMPHIPYLMAKMQRDSVKCGEDVTPHVLVGAHTVEPFWNAVFTPARSRLSQQQCSWMPTVGPARAYDSTPPATASSQNPLKCQQQSRGLMATAMEMNGY